MKKYIVEVYKDMTIWMNEQGQRHREDGPAVEYADGDKLWFLNDRFHREDGPAIEYANFYKAWWMNGKPHREDGPAVEHVNGDKEWWLNGDKLTEEQFNQRMNPVKEMTVADIERIVGHPVKIVKG